jgi:hypothetical protein
MRKVLVAILGACVLALCVATQAAQAKGITICTSDGQNCKSAETESLQAAIDKAGRGSVLELTNGVYTEHNISIKKNVVIRGEDPDQTIIQANDLPCLGSGRTVTETERVFAIFGSRVTMEDVTLRNGCALGGADDAQGGAIWSAGDLTLNHVILQENAAWVVKPEVAASDLITGSALGGAIYNAGILKIDSSSILTNTAAADANGAFGGGIYNNGSATVINTTLAGNRAREYRGGIALYVGGALFSSGSMLSVEYSTFVDNFAPTAAGGLGADDLVHLVNNLFDRNVSFAGTADCIDIKPGAPIQGEARYVDASPCDTPRPPSVQLEGLTSDTKIPVYRPKVSVENQSGSINAGDCKLSAIKTDQLGNARGVGEKCDLGAVEVGMSFLPTLWSAPAKPDLRIRSVTIDPPPGQITAGTKVMITVVVENVGNLATQGTGFYIDMAINPKLTPLNEAGHTWMDFCKTAACEGVIWLSPPTVPEDGGSFTFRTDLDKDEYVVHKSTKFDRYLPAGSVDIWVYADSFDETLSRIGLEDELDETNNQYHYPTFTVKPGRILPVEADEQLSAAGELPPAPPVPPTNVP